MAQLADVWARGAAYEPYMGRWSQLVAREFLSWLNVPQRQRWLDVGCGTGVVVRTILDSATPELVIGIDPAAGFLALARHTLGRPILALCRADARALPCAARAFDTVVSGLVLNFVPEPELAVREMVRVARPGATVAAYVWDYGARMEMLRQFWDAAVELDPSAAALDEGGRFPLCQPAALEVLFVASGLHEVVTRAIDVPTTFRTPDDFWSPFLGGQGPAPAYVAALEPSQRAALRTLLMQRLPIQPNDEIRLTARAWAVRGST